MCSRIRLDLALVSLILSLPFLAFSQTEKEEDEFGKFTAGLRLGICTSQIDGDGYGGYDKLGLTAGLLVNTPISKKTDFQLEINYCNRGSRDPADPDNGKFNSYRINLHYVDIPLLVRFKTWKLKFELGLINGILVSSNEESNLGPVVTSPYDWNRYELAFAAGSNVLITENWNINIRYHRSILPASDEWVIVNRFGVLGGSYNDALLFTAVRYLRFE